MKAFFGNTIYGKWLLAFLLFFCSADIFAQPLHFIPNQGQWEDEVIARSEINSGWFWLGKNGFTYLFYDAKALSAQHLKRSKEAPKPINAQIIKVNFEGADFSHAPQYSQPTTQYYNFYLGNISSNWKTGIYGYGKIYFKDVYPNIDFVLYTNGDALKYDFIVKPGGDIGKIKLHYQGQNDLQLNKDGSLNVETLFGDIREAAPSSYLQQPTRKNIKSSYMLEGNWLQFSIKNYDKRKTLIIDPQLIFSTFSGSLADNFGYTATYDEAGNGYSGGTVFAPGFPTTTGAFQTTFGGGATVNGEHGDIARDMGILKYTPDGSQLIYCTYIGGKHNEDPHSMIVNKNNELIILGNSLSNNFPVTKNAYDTTKNGKSDIVVVRLSEDGKQLLSGTYIGGSGYDALNGYDAGEQYLTNIAFNYGDTYRGEVITDSTGNIYIATTTNSPDFPVKNALQNTFGGGLQDACILSLSPDLSQLYWSTFLGSEGDDAAYSINLNSKGHIYICGGTTSLEFPAGANKPAFANNANGFAADGFVACLSADGSQLLYSTTISTQAYEQCFFVQLDINDDVFLTGQTEGGDEFPTTPGVFKNDFSSQFIVKLTPALDSILISTIFGNGSAMPNLSPSAFLVDKCGQVYFSGWGGGANSDVGSFTTGLPVTDDAFQGTTDGSDFYLAVFTHDLTKLVYATFFGGPKSEEHVDGGTSRFDKRGVVYQSICAGCGGHSDLPTTETAWSRKNKGKRPNNPLQGGCNNALFKMDVNTHPAFTFIVDTCTLSVKFSKDSISANTNVKWLFGDNTSSTELSPTHIYQKPGLYTATVITNFGSDCQDTSSRKVDVASRRSSKLSLYNVITPNNDGLNEFFFIPELDAACEEYDLKIYNRWGEYMYNQKGKNLKWYGTTLNGKDAVEGVYFYILKSPTYGEFNGTITILR